MERTPLHNLSHDDLVGMILQMQKQLTAQAKLMDRQAKRIAELESEVRELRKKNPTQRLEEAYSVKRNVAQRLSRPESPQRRSRNPNDAGESAPQKNC